MVRPALETIPFADIQRQRFHNVTAISTALGAGKPTVNLHKSPTIPLALIVELAYQLTPTSVRDTLCKLVVLHHILNCQILNHDGERFHAPIE